jgi:hypothetical protein
MESSSFFGIEKSEIKQNIEELMRIKFNDYILTLTTEIIRSAEFKRNQYRTTLKLESKVKKQQLGISSSTDFSKSSAEQNAYYDLWRMLSEEDKLIIIKKSKPFWQ